LLIFGALVAYFFNIPANHRLKTPDSTAIQGGTYTNPAFGFSLTMPDGYKASEIPPDPSTGSGQVATTILLQNKNGDGIQILVTPHQDVKALTASMIQQDIPDMKITDAQEVDIGDSYTGVAFRSDNAAFGGDSREVWFIFHGNLYQISTYARLDPILKAIFATWKFE
jgi:hypothetical protein